MSSDPAITPYLFDLYRIVESRSWKSTADAAIGRDPKWVEYYEGLLGARQPMHLSIHVLLLDGVPIAGLINGSFQKGLYALHIAYDQGLSRLAPGAAVLLMGMRQAIDGRFAFFDLLWGFGYYKTRWLAEMTETRSVQIYRKGGIFFWRRMLGDLKRRMLWTWNRAGVRALQSGEQGCHRAPGDAGRGLPAGDDCQARKARRRAGCAGTPRSGNSFRRRRWPR